MFILLNYLLYYYNTIQLFIIQFLFIQITCKFW